MTSIIRFIAFTLIIVIVAWAFAVFTAWWIGMFVLTMLCLMLAGKYLTEVVENYIID